MNIINLFEQWAEQKNITLEHNNEKNDITQNEVLKKFENLKTEKCFLDFLKAFSKVESEDQKVWFWCFNDYRNSNNPDEFTWNELEKMSLSYAENDIESNKIKEWWRLRLPISLSLKDEYSYVAIDFSDNSSRIITGNEPIFEDSEIIANSFEDFLNRIITGEIDWF